MVPIPNGYIDNLGISWKGLWKRFDRFLLIVMETIIDRKKIAKQWTPSSSMNCSLQHFFCNCFFGFVVSIWCFPHEKLFVLLIWWSGERSWLSDNSWKVFWSSGKCFAYNFSSRICWFSFPYILTNRYFGWLESCLPIFSLTSQKVWELFTLGKH